MDSQKTMIEEWEKVRQDYYYPQLPIPRLSDEVPNGQINIKNLEIKVNEKFVKSFQKYGIGEAEAYNEIFSHELTHFMKFPGSVLNILRLQKIAMQYVNPVQASTLRVAFTEAQTNIYQVLEKKNPNTVKMTNAVKPDPNDGLNNLMYGLYQEVWKKDLGIKLGREEKDLIKKLKEINYTDKNVEQDSFREFVLILKDYKPKEQKNKKGGKGEGQDGQGQSCDDNGVGVFSDNQIREGIRKFAQECNNPGEFEKTVQQVLGEGQQKEKREEEKQKTSTQATGLLPGTDKGITLISNNFYSALAEKYSIPIRKKPLKKNGSLYPNSHTDFSISDSFSDIDPYSSQGIMPGVTKKWVRREGEVATNYESVPNNIVVMDNSPSMFVKGSNYGVVSPEENIFLHIVGATAISNAYLDNDSSVAVYSFGSNDHFTNFTKNKEEIHKELRRFSKDGGTTFNKKYLEAILRQTQEQYDITVISDMVISNFNDFINQILNIPQIHRIHLLYTNNASYTMYYVNVLRVQFGNKENIAILPLIYEPDIKKIVMGELKKSVR